MHPILRHDAVYFNCACMQLETMVLTFPERNPRVFSLAFISVAEASSLKIQKRFVQQETQIFVQSWQPHEDRLPREYPLVPLFY
jgi:hypothetical protein